MNRFSSFFRNVTLPKVISVFIFLILLTYSILASASFLISRSEYASFEKNFAETILKTIESGPLRFSRIHASFVAQEQLQELMHIINNEKQALIEIEVTTGRNFSETLANVRQKESPLPENSCVSAYESIRNFDDAFFPYRTKILINRCTFSDGLKSRFYLILGVGFFIVSALLFFALCALKPINESYRILLDLINSPDKCSHLTENDLPFVPFRRLAREFKETQRLRVDAAIARTTQMLAHDVRKPFALFRMTLDRVKSAESPQSIQHVLREALPEVERSLASVNGLITDILNVGGEFNLVLKPVRLALVIDDAVAELRRLYPKKVLTVNVDVGERVWVQADDTRLPRVFLNILSNAIEAVDDTDVHLWVTAQANSVTQIEIRVGNSGSYVPPDLQNKLFELFYTSGKKGGTGLGLAIVTKIIDAHGSTVACHSEKNSTHPNGQVEFVWCLKAAKEPQPEAPNQIAEAPQENTRMSSSTDSKIERPNVVFLDDSPLARWVWESKLKNRVFLRCFAGPGEFWEALEKNVVSIESIDTFITDHYFSPNEKLTGVEFAMALRERGFKGRILLASNGEFDANQLKGIVDKIVDKQPTDWEKLAL